MIQNMPTLPTIREVNDSLVSLVRSGLVFAKRDENGELVFFCSDKRPIDTIPTEDVILELTSQNN